MRLGIGGRRVANHMAKVPDARPCSAADHAGGSVAPGGSGAPRRPIIQAIAIYQHQPSESHLSPLNLAVSLVADAELLVPVFGDVDRMRLLPPPVAPND